MCIPFALSFIIFPLKQAGSPLFETLMAIVLASCGTLFAVLWFRDIRSGFVLNGLKVGLLWSAMSVIFDAPFSCSVAPAEEPPDYLADIGSTYLVYPVITVGVGMLLRHRESAQALA